MGELLDNLVLLERAKLDGTIADWQLNQSSLEDVFVKVLTSSEEDGEEGEVNEEVALLE
jgi:hypothetical protein